MKTLRSFIKEVLLEDQAHTGESVHLDMIDDYNILQEGIVQDVIDKIKAQGRSAISKTKEFFKNLKQELSETKEGTVILTKMVMRKELTPAEGDALKQQAKDLAKGIPLLALFLIPGAGIPVAILVKLASKFGVDLLPTSFKEG
jgi:hypothetical protein